MVFYSYLIRNLHQEHFSILNLPLKKSLIGKEVCSKSAAIAIIYFF